MVYHQFYFDVLGLHVVLFGFAGCGCPECSCWDGSSVVCRSANMAVRCGSFKEIFSGKIAKFFGTRHSSINLAFEAV
jgi:hypothetical protein